MFECCCRIFFFIWDQFLVDLFIEFLAIATSFFSYELFLVELFFVLFICCKFIWVDFLLIFFKQLSFEYYRMLIYINLIIYRMKRTIVFRTFYLSVNPSVIIFFLLPINLPIDKNYQWKIHQWSIFVYNSIDKLIIKN